MVDFDPNKIPPKVFALIGQKAIVLNEKNEILLLKRSSKINGSGKWSLPGGMLENSEDPIEGIIREISEEVQLTVSGIIPFSLRSRLEDGDFKVIIGYICVATNDNVQLNWEHDEFEWLSVEQALQLDLTTDGKFFLEKFRVKNSNVSQN